MAYIGVQPKAGQYRKLDDISGGFNGGTATFNLTVSNEAVSAATAQQLMISLGGVIQNPGVDYTVATNTITFTTNPASGLDFFGVLLGDSLDTGTPSDGTVTTAKLASDLTVDLASGTAGSPSLTFDPNSGLFSPANDEVSISTNGTERFRFGPTGEIGIGGATYGTSGQVLTSGGSGAAPTWSTAGNLTRGTAAATTSGTDVDFTSLPAGIRKITVVLDQVSINTTNNVFVRFSTGGTFAETGYESQSMRIQNASTSAAVTDTTQFVIINNDNASRLWTGSFTWHNITGNTWVMSGNCNTDGNARAVVCSGVITLGGVLDGLRLRTTGAFDNGQINIFYEV